MTRTKLKALMYAMSFVVGFTVVFIILGASATWLGTFVSFRLSFFSKAAGIVVIGFGLVKLGAIRWVLLQRDIRLTMTTGKAGLLSAFAIGACFAFGWTPCIGPILAGILAYAGTLENVNKGIVLLLVYSLGLGVPFLMTALGIDRFLRIFGIMKRHLGLLEKLTGLAMVAFGILIFTDSLIRVPAFLPFLNRFAL